MKLIISHLKFFNYFQLSKPGRVPAIADMPGILTGVNVMDFCWDPFDNNRLAVGNSNTFLDATIL